MKRRKKKYIFVSIILIIIIGFITFNFIDLKADSGWDTDFDFDFGSSSDWGSSDWGSSSDWDSDWGSDWGSSGSYGGGYSSSNDVTFDFYSLVLATIIFVILAIVLSIKEFRKYNRSLIYKTNVQGNQIFDKTISEEEIKAHIPDFNKETFLERAYNIFLEVQSAWSDFDYDMLRSLLTDELYNTYHTQLIALKAKRRKNIMYDFYKKNIDIVGIDINKDKIAITVGLVVSFYDFVVDDSNEVVRGNRKFKVSNSYNLTFISNMTNQNKKKKETKICPSCGAELNNESSNICPYCKSVVIFNNHDWLLSKKEIRR